MDASLNLAIFKPTVVFANFLSSLCWIKMPLSLWHCLLGMQPVVSHSSSTLSIHIEWTMGDPADHIEWTIGDPADHIVLTEDLDS